MRCRSLGQGERRQGRTAAQPPDASREPVPAPWPRESVPAPSIPGGGHGLAGIALGIGESGIGDAAAGCIIPNAVDFCSAVPGGRRSRVPWPDDPAAPAGRTSNFAVFGEDFCAEMDLFRTAFPCLLPRVLHKVLSPHRIPRESLIPGGVRALTQREGRAK